MGGQVGGWEADPGNAGSSHPKVMLEVRLSALCEEPEWGEAWRRRRKFKMAAPEERRES